MKYDIFIKKYRKIFHKTLLSGFYLMQSNMENISRRDFLAKAALAAAGVTAGASSVHAQMSNDTGVLSLAETEFLNTYSSWIMNFKEVTEVQKNNYNDAENNKRLIQLTVEAESWQNELKTHMKSKAFMNEYLKLTSELAQSINYDRSTLNDL